MNGDADLPHRSSSPLKRRASSMEPEDDTNAKGGSESNAVNGFPRAMSVDPPESQSNGTSEKQTPSTSGQCVARKCVEFELTSNNRAASFHI